MLNYQAQMMSAEGVDSWLDEGGCLVFFKKERNY